MVKNGKFYHLKEYKEKQRLSHLGEKNPVWKGGNTYGYYSPIYIPLIKTLKQECSLCGSTNKLIAHHIDKNFKNNNLDNLSIVCRGCHNKIHKKGIPQREW